MGIDEIDQSHRRDVGDNSRHTLTALINHGQQRSIAWFPIFNSEMFAAMEQSQGQSSGNLPLSLL